MTSDSQINRDQSGGLEACVTAWSPPPTIEELAGAEGNLMAELIQSFTADMEDRLQRIRGAMTSSNPAILRCEVHAIKGSSKQMAAFRVASVCEQIEAAERGRPLSQLSDLVRQLEVRVGEVCDAMAGYRSTYARGIS